MTRPSDHQLRQRALDPTASFIVQAPAGSGKTELLVRRYLTLLAQVNAPEEILAITFTRKATAEMRQRIANALHGVQDDGQPEDNPELLAIVEKVHTNDRRHGWQISSNTRRLRILTIDAFCYELVCRMPWSARFGAPPSIVDDATPLFQQAAKLTIDHIERSSQWSASGRQLVCLVDADLSRARSLLVDMLGQRDKWIRLLGPASRKRVESMWQLFIEAELRRTHDLIPLDLQNELIAIAAIVAGNLHGTADKTGISVLHEFRHFPSPDYRRLAQWQGIAALVLTGEGTIRKTLNKNQGFAAGDKVLKGRMKDLLEQLSRLPGAVHGLAGLAHLPPGGFSDSQWHSLEALIHLLPLAAAELNLLFKERNEADYIELSQRAGTALGQMENPSELAMIFDHSLRHLLMDEFQDTSSGQIELLSKLTAGWQNGDGRTAFFVGDPMQSIYRFRQAEVANFLQVQQHGLGDIRPESIALQTNFRSAPALVNWFNQTFQQVLPDHDDIVNSAVSYSTAAPFAENNLTGIAQFHAVHGGDTENEAIATLIGEIQHQSPGESIAVLGRTRNHLNAIAVTLRRRGVDFHGIDLERLSDRPAIRDLISITRALIQPADRIAWLSLLRAPWCGMGLADISLLVCPDPEITVFELWQDASYVHNLSPEGSKRFSDMMTKLEQPMTLRGRIDLRQNVESAWLGLGGPATVSKQDLDDCQHFFELLEQLESQGADINPASLDNAAKNLWANSSIESNLQLLTIHKAKGLEFDTVILPALHRQQRAADKELLRWRKLPDQLLIAPLPASTDSKDGFYEYLERLEKAENGNESGRLLYVACTRARKNLHLFANVKNRDDQLAPPARTSSLALLWPTLELADTEHSQQKSTDTASIDVTEQPRQLRRLPAKWLPPALPTSISCNKTTLQQVDDVEFSWVGETARVAGIVIHQILQQVDETGWQHWRNDRVGIDSVQLWENRLAEHGLCGDNLESAIDIVVQAIENTRKDPIANWIFSDQHQCIESEWQVTGVVGNQIVHGVIDRSFIDQDGIRWIIDFKSSRHEGADSDAFLNRERQRHHRKMMQYSIIVGQLQSNDIRLALYFPLLKGWREWTPETATSAANDG